jgi:hypothetical protein
MDTLTILRTKVSALLVQLATVDGRSDYDNAAATCRLLAELYAEMHKKVTE